MNAPQRYRLLKDYREHNHDGIYFEARAVEYILPEHRAVVKEGEPEDNIVFIPARLLKPI